MGVCGQGCEFLREAAVRTWRYFREYSTAGKWLIPDNVREDGVQATRLSPTNLGLLLNARIAAVHFGYLTLPEFVQNTRETLERFIGSRATAATSLNWYSTESFRALEPRFVSTVDSGNLAACLWTMKQAALSFAAKPPRAELLKTGLQDIEKQAALELEAGTAGFWSEELAERTRQMRQWLDAGMTDELAAKSLDPSQSNATTLQAK